MFKSNPLSNSLSNPLILIMCSQFKCIVEINDEKYDIVINDDISSVYFTDIYEKIQQILKLAQNEEQIHFQTHLFQVVDTQTNRESTIESFDHFVKHLSLIRITRRPEQQLIPQCYAIPISPLNPYLSHPYLSYPYLTNGAPLDLLGNTGHTNQPTNANPSAAKEFIPHEYYCDVCSVSVDRSTDPRLAKHKMNLNFDSYKQYKHLLATVSTKSKGECDSISDYKWLNVIPAEMRAFGYKNVSDKLWINCFRVFRSKYIEAMEVSPNTCTACSLFPFLHEFNAFKFDSTKDDYKKIMDLRAKLRTNLHSKQSLGKPLTDESKKSGQTEDTTDTEPNEPDVNTIIKQLSRKTVKSVVPVVNISKTKTKRKKNKNCVNLSDERRKGIESKLRLCSADIKAYHHIIQLINMFGQCFGQKTKNKLWSVIANKMGEYGYDKRLYSCNQCRNQFYIWTQYYAQIFDEAVLLKLDPVSQKVFDLFKVIHTIDLSKIYKQSNQTFRRLNTISKSHEIKDYLLKTRLNNEIILRKINDKNNDEINERIGDKKVETSRENNGNKTDTVIQSDSCLTTVPMDLEDGEVTEENTIEDIVRDTKPVVNSIANNVSVIALQSVTTADKPGQSATPLHDPRLKPSQPIQPAIRDPRIKSPQVGPLPVPSATPSHDPRLKPSQPIQPAIRDPRIKSPQVGPQPVPSATPIRDPRIKRKLDSQTNELNKLCVNNSDNQSLIPNKKIKLEPID